MHLYDHGFLYAQTFGRYPDNTRHSGARVMEDAGAKVSAIQAKLGHESLATTGRYLAALHAADNTHGDAMARMFGMDVNNDVNGQ